MQFFHFSVYFLENESHDLPKEESHSPNYYEFPYGSLFSTPTKDNRTHTQHSDYYIDD